MDGWVHEEERERVLRALGLWQGESAPITLIVSDPISWVLTKGRGQPFTALGKHQTEEPVTPAQIRGSNMG